MSEFNKKVGQIIDKDKADKLKHNWKKHSGIATESNFFGADIIQALLSKPGAVGIRIAYGMDDNKIMQPVLYAADANGNVIKASSSGKDGSLDDGADASLPCPPVCPTSTLSNP